MRPETRSNAHTPDPHAAADPTNATQRTARLAADGYAGATTAAICRTARIGSGTFFHYFPTKNAVLVAILDYGTQETRDWFAAQQHRGDARGVIVDWLKRSAKELEDPRVAGFVQAVGAVMTQPEVAAALHRDEVAEHEELQPWVCRAQTQGTVRSDLSSAELTTWILLLIDGFIGRVATLEDFTAAAQCDQLLDTAQRLIAP